MILAPWMRLSVACGLLLWFAGSLGEWPLRFGLLIIAALWIAWAVVGAMGDDDGAA